MVDLNKTPFGRRERERERERETKGVDLDLLNDGMSFVISHMHSSVLLRRLEFGDAMRIFYLR